MAKFKPYKIESPQLENLSISEGQFIIATDTKKVYLDESNSDRIELIPVPTKTSDLTNDSGFIDNNVNNLVNYFKKVDITLPVYFVEAGEHATSSNAFVLAEKPKGLYIFGKNDTQGFNLYLKPRESSTAKSYACYGFFMLYIKDVIPTIYTNDIIVYSFENNEKGFAKREIIVQDNHISNSQPSTIIEFVTKINSQTISGVKTFSALPKSSITPTDADHLTRKGYVDAQIALAGIPKITNDTHFEDLEDGCYMVYDPMNNGIEFSVADVYDYNEQRYTGTESFTLTHGQIVYIYKGHSTAYGNDYHIGDKIVIISDYGINTISFNSVNIHTGANEYYAELNWDYFYSIYFDKEYADKTAVLTKTNTTSYTPTSNYHPATKKYVDDSIGAISTGIHSFYGTTDPTTVTGSVDGDIYIVIDA